MLGWKQEMKISLSAAVLVTLPTDLRHVQSLKVSLQKRHSIKQEKSINQMVSKK